MYEDEREKTTNPFRDPPNVISRPENHVAMDIDLAHQFVKSTPKWYESLRLLKRTGKREGTGTGPVPRTGLLKVSKNGLNPSTICFK